MFRKGFVDQGSQSETDYDTRLDTANSRVVGHTADTEGQAAQPG